MMKRIGRSFRFAWEGFHTSVKKETNLKIHLFVAAVVILFGFCLRISRLEWAVVLLTIGGMISLELVNTAIERVVDLLKPECHPLAKEAKDVAAASCLFFAVVSALVGAVIFLPKLLP
ncbi:diacylglycerol kinase family protein [Caldibacillus debilis]|jgi:undecaprenol kinase|uniref:Undecaprenol kinase n=3 Tax=Caldibacillus debilis TaxID=301148 RepID=A0A420VE19_9BACI|nr:diacylglycerol kinase family protein [Caldibacillus debilis]KYD22446.1 Diacylglycerol kinase [Caldibacillus debilis]OUM89131.1 MAG: UDP kinase [Caldibacillus debilis]RKO61932.1 undecaprenol kinase [Caldibacillus debilis GB1]